MLLYEVKHIPVVDAFVCVVADTSRVIRAVGIACTAEEAVKQARSRLGRVEEVREALGELQRFLNMLQQEVLEGGVGRELAQMVDASALPKTSASVLLKTLKIPRGCVTTYKALSEAVGIARGWRAVARALSQNPYPIVFPCHRVVRSDLSLGGYTGGVELKKRLLEVEGVSFINTRVSPMCLYSPLRSSAENEEIQARAVRGAFSALPQGPPPSHKEDTGGG